MTRSGISRVKTKIGTVKKQLHVYGNSSETGWTVFLTFGVSRARELKDSGDLLASDINNNVHLSCAHQRPERSHDTY